MFTDLNDENFMFFAMKCYDSPTCTKHEFDEDIKRLKYVKRLLKKYRIMGEMRERLILNHIIILSNVFGASNVARLLFFKVEEKDYPVLKTFLLFLNLMPEIVYSINGKHVISADVTVDIFVGKRLRQI